MSSKPKPNKSRAKTKVVENLVKHMLLVGALPPVPSLPQQRRTLVSAWVITDKRRPYPRALGGLRPRAISATWRPGVITFTKDAVSVT